MILALGIAAYVLALPTLIFCALLYYARDERRKDRKHQRFMQRLTGEEHSYRCLYGHLAPERIDRPSRARRHA